MGGVIVKSQIHDAFMRGPEHAVELFTATPIRRIRSPARRPAALDPIAREGLFQAPRARADMVRAVMSLKACRTCSISAASDHCRRRPGVTPRMRSAGARYDAMVHAFERESLMIRTTGDRCAHAALIVSDAQIGEIVEKVARVIKAVA
jgi:beta-alanine--pyruvate transaminase